MRLLLDCSPWPCQVRNTIGGGPVTMCWMDPQFQHYDPNTPIAECTTTWTEGVALAEIIYIMPGGVQWRQYRGWHETTRTLIQTTPEIL